MNPKAEPTRSLRRTASRQLVAFERMKVRDVAQREFKEAWGRKILGEFDPEKFKTPVLNHVNQWYYIIDGQHGIWAAKQWLVDWQKQKIECDVYENMTVDEEAEYFLCYNNVRHIPVFDKFRIALTAKREEETNINAIVQKHGINVALSGQEGTIACVATLTRVFRYGQEVLDSSLLIALHGIGFDGLEADVIGGIGVAKNRYNGGLDDRKTIAALSGLRGGLSGWRTRAERLRMKTAHAKTDCMAAALVEIVNKHTRGKTKLPGWFKDQSAE